jgi:TPP-dependent trihydroxycyclohexane-1,2-dione (THcHDO) dehydratase
MEWRNEMQIRARLVRQPRRHVVALEGDGSLLMQLGCLSTIAAFKPKKLTIVIMDKVSPASHDYDACGPITLDAGNFSCGIDRSDPISTARNAFISLSKKSKNARTRGVRCISLWTSK